MIFLSFLFIGLIIARVAVGYFAPAVPFLGKLALPLTLLSIAAGIVWLIFIGIEIYNNLRGKK